MLLLKGTRVKYAVILNEVKDPVVRRMRFCLRDSSPLRGSDSYYIAIA